MKGAQLVLASASPRRKALLRQLGLRCHVVIPEVDEALQRGELPVAYVRRLAQWKAEAGARLARDLGIELPVLAADTVVLAGEAVLGKPSDRAAALRMLEQLSGNTHRVLTALAVLNGDALQVCHVTTDVTFRETSQHERERYWQTGEPVDKAGAYGIQGIGGIFVERIEGSYTGVMGLPVAELEQLLRAAGVDTWRSRANKRA